jgi:hypothetical protein
MAQARFNIRLACLAILCRDQCRILPESHCVIVINIADAADLAVATAPRHFSKSFATAKDVSQNRRYNAQETAAYQPQTPLERGASLIAGDSGPVLSDVRLKCTNVLKLRFFGLNNSDIDQPDFTLLTVCSATCLYPLRQPSYAVDATPSTTPSPTPIACVRAKRHQCTQPLLTGARASHLQPHARHRPF